MVSDTNIRFLKTYNMSEKCNEKEDDDEILTVFFSKGKARCE